jgi:protein-S-isoprenylcysteine O-methyltransferase Ste14
VSTVSESGARSSSSKRTGALVLGVVGVLLLIVAIIYGISGHHALRTSVSAVVGVIALGIAAWLYFGGRKSARS